MMELGTDFFVVAAIMVFLISMSKAGLAAGFGALGVPVLLLYVSPAIAAGILLPLMILVDSANLWIYRNHFQRRYLKMLIIGAIAGISLGALAFGIVQPEWVRLMVGIIALTFASMYFLKGILPKTQGKLPLRYGLVFGAISGFTSHLAHAGGPPVRGFLLNQDLPKSQFIGTFGFFFAAVNWMKLPPYLYFGQVNWDTLQIGLYLLPMVPLGILTGVLIHKKLSQTLFTKIAYVLLTLAGLKLVYDGVSQILA